MAARSSGDRGQNLLPSGIVGFSSSMRSLANCSPRPAGRLPHDNANKLRPMIVQLGSDTSSSSAAS